MATIRGALERLRTGNYAILPRYALFSPAMEARVFRYLEEQADPESGRMRWLYHYRQALRDQELGRLKDLLDVGLVDPANQALRRERLKIKSIIVRAAGPRSPFRAMHPHADEGHLVLAYGSPGTILYPIDSSGKVRRIAVPGHCGVVLSGQRRETALGIPSIIHQAWLGEEKRIVLLVLLKRERDARVTASVRQQVAQRIRCVRKMLAGRS